MVPTADKTTITIISLINDYNDMCNISVSSKNLLMFTRVIVAIIVTQNLLSRNQIGRQRVWHDVIFVFKTSENSNQNVKKKRRFWIREIFKKMSLSLWVLWLVKQARTFMILDSDTKLSTGYSFGSTNEFFQFFLADFHFPSLFRFLFC